MRLVFDGGYGYWNRDMMAGWHREQEPMGNPDIEVVESESPPGPSGDFI